LIRFILRAAGLWIFVCALLLAARLIGSAQPVPENVAILHLTDCELPCWIGIIPGQTTFEDARQRVQEVYGNLSDHTLIEGAPGSYVITSRTRGDAGLSYIYIAEEGGDRGPIVASIVFSGRMPPRDNPTMGWLHDTFGSPAYIFLEVTRSGTTYRPYLQYPQYGITVGLEESECGRITIDSPVVLLTLYKDITPLEKLAYRARRWHGFDVCNPILEPR